MSTSDGQKRESMITSIPDEKIPKSADSKQSLTPTRESQGISQIDLKDYQFSPPGPMGWTANEYEDMIKNLQNDDGRDE